MVIRDYTIHLQDNVLEDGTTTNAKFVKVFDQLLQMCKAKTKF